MITYPHYVVVEIINVIVPDPRKPGTAHMQVLQPPVRKLFPLPMQLTQEQNAAPGKARAEIEIPTPTGAMVLRTVELFDDVLQAVEDANSYGKLIARPVQREKIGQAAHIALATSVLGEEATEKALQAAKEAGAIRWDEAMPKVGGSKIGDLRIMPDEMGGFRVEIFAFDELPPADQPDAKAWGRNGLPRELARSFSSVNEARIAIRTAGYGRRLVGDGE